MLLARSAQPRFPLALRFGVGFDGDGFTPSRFATDSSAITRPPAECPLRRSLLPSLSSFFVGGFIFSLVAIGMGLLAHRAQGSMFAKPSPSAKLVRYFMLA